MRKPVRKLKETVEMRSSLLGRLRRHRYFPPGVLVLVFLLACFFHIWQRVKVIELVKDVGSLKTENAELVDAATKLNAEIASLCTAGRIEKYATDTLGLSPVTADRIYTLAEEHRVVTDPDELSTLMKAIERVTAYMPVISENQALAGDAARIKLDSTAIGGNSR